MVFKLEVVCLSAESAQKIFFLEKIGHVHVAQTPFFKAASIGFFNLALGLNGGAAELGEGFFQCGIARQAQQVFFAGVGFGQAKGLEVVAVCAVRSKTRAEGVRWEIRTTSCAARRAWL